jgi:hypothetical protein
MPAEEMVSDNSLFTFAIARDTFVAMRAEHSLALIRERSSSISRIQIIPRKQPSSPLPE